MKAVVVHESMFGNTRRVAEAVAAALQPGFGVEITGVEGATTALLGAADLVVLGAPTHGHGLSRPQTRAQTLRNGVPAAIAQGPGMREVLARLPAGRGRPAAAFDTRLRWPVWLSGAASRHIAAALRAAGYALVAAPESFIVSATAGPMRDGEIERAGAWGAHLAHLAGPTAPVATADRPLAGVR